MLTRSFCCFDGITPDAERMLWRAGFIDWRHLSSARPPLSAGKIDRMTKQLAELYAARDGDLIDYFIQHLPPGYRLRAWPNFARDAAFLDIETTGLEASAEISVIGLFFQGQWFQFVQGRDLYRFLSVWRRIGLVITFNGLRFDVPMLCRRFGIKNGPPHIDLMHEARIFGYTGGLKQIERRLGISRSNPNIDGNIAVLLWRNYCERRDETSLQALLDYNREDVMNLRRIAHSILKKSCEGYNAGLPDLADL